MGWVAKLWGLKSLLKDEVAEKPMVGYHPLVATDLLAWDISTDNGYLTQVGIPFHFKGRLDMDLTFDSFEVRSLERCESLLPEPGPIGLFRVIGDEASDPITIGILKLDLEVMEGSIKFNPHGLILRRNDDGSPRLWREDLLPQDTPWAWLNREYYARYVRMRDECNRAHPTNESPATLLLLHVIWWFKTGGKCHIFGFMVVPYVRYDSIYSYGRAVWYMDIDGHDTNEPIVAGTAMASGCLVLLPTNMLDLAQFDFRLCTVIVESWKANTSRYNFPVSIYVALILQMMQIKESTKWYDAPKSRDQYRTALPRPPAFATRSARAIIELANGPDDELESYQSQINARERPSTTDRVES
ncbi:hypothetical protein LTR17_027689 [Elasticomyces elasticus]|nr:hypothetical protein LTR17_027689 [Elasticomyces elasticus]